MSGNSRPSSALTFQVTVLITNSPQVQFAVRLCYSLSCVFGIEIAHLHPASWSVKKKAWTVLSYETRFFNRAVNIPLPTDILQYSHPPTMYHGAEEEDSSAHSSRSDEARQAHDSSAASTNSKSPAATSSKGAESATGKDDLNKVNQRSHYFMI